MRQDTLKQWHTLSRADAARTLAADLEHGLSPEEVARRIAEHGPNRLAEKPGTPEWQRFAAQLIQPLVLVLVVAGTVTAVLGAWVDSAVIFGVVVVNAVIGYVQEGRAEAALKALMSSVATEVSVVRAGQTLRRPAHDLVPGDLVVLAAGDKVPADLRLSRSAELRVDEAALTGESVPVSKHVNSLAAETPLAERGNMAYSGTAVVAGSGRGVVVATGERSETGQIARAIADTVSLATPLTRQLSGFARQLLLVISGLAVFTFVVGLLRGEALYDMFMAAVALAVGAIPEGLPAAVTVTLAIGVGRMAKRRAVIRRMPAVEALGSATVICTDKTGTLTENAMTVRAIHAGGRTLTVGGHGYQPSGEFQRDGLPAKPDGVWREVLLAGLLCNDATLHHDGRHWTISGDPTEAALLVVARKAGLDEAVLAKAMPRLAERPFSSEKQWMATLHEVEGSQLIYLKGAVERVLARCDRWLDEHGQLRGLDAEAKASFEQEARRMAEGGLRVLALARRQVPRVQAGVGARAEAGTKEVAGIADALLADALVCLGLVGMIDPPRASAAAAIRSCHRAGVAVKMITGDHAVTALAIARQLGLIDAGQGRSERVLSGAELAELDDAALREAVRHTHVFARVEPTQKLRLVQALQANGEVVAMTGDGVNDAPALKAADIGVAMGGAGTEVAKEAADMVLTDDNFATIEAAIEEGRGVYDNLVKFVTWTLPTNFGEGFVILAAIVAGVQLPITPLQILWINMTTAVLLGMTLSFEPVERGGRGEKGGGVMYRPPRIPGSPVLDPRLVWRVALVSAFMLAGAFGLFLLHQSRGASLEEARTVAVNVFVMIEVFYLFNCRSLDRSFFSVGLFSNRWIWGGVALMLTLQGLLTYLPAMNRAFATAPISLAAWGEIVAVAALASAVIALEKTFLNRRRARHVHLQKN